MSLHVTLREVLIAGGVFLGSLLASSAIVAALLVLLPADYFAPGPMRRRVAAPGGALLAARLLGKNLLGVLLVVVGVVLSVPGVPGQGLLTILTGVILLDIPGKRGLERRLIARPPIRRSIDGLRRRFGRAPLELDAPPAEPPSPRPE